MTNTRVRWCRDGEKEMTSIDFIRVLKSYYPIIRAADDKGAIYPALNLASVSLGARKLLHSCEYKSLMADIKVLFFHYRLLWSPQKLDLSDNGFPNQSSVSKSCLYGSSICVIMLIRRKKKKTDNAKADISFWDRLFRKRILKWVKVSVLLTQIVLIISRMLWYTVLSFSLLIHSSRVYVATDFSSSLMGMLRGMASRLQCQIRNLYFFQYV